MHSLPLPLQIGGSRITADRVSGPPSKMLPVLRDLFTEREAIVAIEVDTARGRHVGILIALRSPHATTLWITKPTRTTCEKPPAEWEPAARVGLKLSDIIAFRVLGLLVETLPFRGEVAA